MYKDFFGFRIQPFNVTPDPSFLFLSRTHQDALNQVLYGIRQRQGFLRVTGEVGTGKTILCRCLLNELSGEAATAYLFNPFLSKQELLRAINEDFGIPASAEDPEKKLIDDLNTFLLEKQRAGQTAVLILDEAQDLSELLLEQVRLLSNLETDREKLLQIVLVGQPELEEKLRDPRLRQIRERMAVNVTLRKLDLQETVGYISHRLAVAGGREDVHFPGGALDRVFELTEGVPRRINLLCDRALLVGLVKGNGEIDASMVEEAGRDLGWKRPLLPKVSPFPDLRPHLSRLLQTAGVLALLAVVAFLGWKIAGKGAPSNLVSGLPGTSSAGQVSSGRGVSNAASAAKAERDSRLRLLWSIREQLRLAAPPEDSRASAAGLAAHYRLKSMTVTLNDSLPRSVVKPLLMQAWIRGEEHPELWVVARAAGPSLEVYDGSTGELRKIVPELIPGKPITLFLFYESKAGEGQGPVTENSGPEIERLQKQLRALGDYQGPINGNLDESTRAALEEIQTRYGLSVDGVADPQVLTLLSYLAGPPGALEGAPSGTGTKGSINHEAAKRPAGKEPGGQVFGTVLQGVAQFFQVELPVRSGGTWIPVLVVLLCFSGGALAWILKTNNRTLPEDGPSAASAEPQAVVDLSGGGSGDSEGVAAPAVLSPYRQPGADFSSSPPDSDFSGGSDAAGGYFRQGLKLYREKKIGEAAQSFESVLELNPKSAAAANNLGILYVKLNLQEKAVQAFQQALAADPEHALAHNNLGTLYAKQGLLDRAAEEYLAALKVEPDYPSALYNLAWLHARRGEAEKSLDYLERAVQIEPGLRETARKAQGFSSLRDRGEFRKLVEP